jgi:hypothetical protein
LRLDGNLLAAEISTLGGIDFPGLRKPPPLFAFCLVGDVPMFQRESSVGTAKPVRSIHCG